MSRIPFAVADDASLPAFMLWPQSGDSPSRPLASSLVERVSANAWTHMGSIHAVGKTTSVDTRKNQAKSNFTVLS
ncbi:MAG: hypothetical protein WCI94_13125 [Rhodospirillales bacterium]